MGEKRILVYLVLLFNYLLVAETETSTDDFIALKSLSGNWQNIPQSWSGSDPCDDGWDGIKCKNTRVTSISLPSMNLTGDLSGDIGSLSELEALVLSYNTGLTGQLPTEIGNLKKLSNLFLLGCGFTGPIPESIGSLQQLVFLSLNSNHFSGQIPASIGNLSKLWWLDLTDNQFEGPIPVSSGGAPGLDMLYNTKHFHLGRNRLSGEIPPQLFSSEMTLIHVVLHDNKLTGSIPLTLGLVQSLEVVRFDSNSLNGSVPPNIGNLTNVFELYLSNNKLSGPLPNLSEMKSLRYLDMSNNSFDLSDFPPWLSTLPNLTTLKMENTELTGEVPVSLFRLTELQNVVLKSNKLNGTLDIGTAHGKELLRIELQHNNIEKFEQHDKLANTTIMLAYNPICDETGSDQDYCKNSPLNITYSAPSSICVHPVPCSSDRILSPSCKCAYPYIGFLTFRTPSFPDWQKYVHFEQNLTMDFKENNLPVDSVSLSNLATSPFQDLVLSLKVFPSGQDHFNQTGISSISCLLTNLTQYPFYFTADIYGHCEGPTTSSKSSNVAFIIGEAVGGFVLLLLLVLAGFYVFHLKRKAEKEISHSNPFGHWLSKYSKGMNHQFKGIRQFSFAEIQKYTRNFSQDNDIGCGGYGKVYKGTLPNGQLVAIKRAQRDSKQGGAEFKAEIQLLSRVHHKNLVILEGFCFERGEQMLVYEYVPNGTLHDSISGKSGIILDWIRRLKVALGAAKGLAYLHEHANPPVIHRDIKSNNILLDENLDAKVADFGLSKSMVDCEKDHVTTQVKGTMGYLDPEYYTGQKLTEKSDVYSFGVLLLELITARKPIQRGKYIVKVVRNLIDKTQDLYGLHEIIDPVIIDSGSTTLKGVEKLVDLSMKCLEESGADRPTMSDVVKEIESLLHLADLNDIAESEASNSTSYDEIIRGSSQKLYSNESFDSSVVPLTTQK